MDQARDTSESAVRGKNIFIYEKRWPLNVNVIDMSNEGAFKLLRFNIMLCWWGYDI